MAKEVKGSPVTISLENKAGLLDVGYRVTEEGQERRQQHFLLGSLDPLSYHLVLVGRPLKHALGPLDVEEDVGEDADGVLVAPHHEVGEAHVVIGGHLALRHPGVHALRRTDEPLEGRQPPLNPTITENIVGNLPSHPSLHWLPHCLLDYPTPYVFHGFLQAEDPRPVPSTASLSSHSLCFLPSLGPSPCCRGTFF